MRAEQLTGRLAYHGEGPMWDADRGRLLWVDLLAGDVLATQPDGVTERIPVSGVAACVVLRRSGGLAVATERGFTLLDGDDRIEEELPDVWEDTTVRMNDGACDPAGRFLCGSMAYDVVAGRASLYRLDPDRSVHVVRSGVTISNGLAWSHDGATVYYVDSPTQRIEAFEYDDATGSFGTRRTVVEIPAEIGTPDGLTIDAEGALWVALWGGRAVHRYWPDGRLDGAVEVPVPQVSSCAFGGEDLGDLYITTSGENLPPEEIGEAGSLFVVRPGVLGLLPDRFAG